MTNCNRVFKVAVLIQNTVFQLLGSLCKFRIFRSGNRCGGVLIGFASAALMYFNGKIAGIFGIFRGLLVPQSGAIAWRAMFIGGIVLAGLVMVLISPQMFVDTA
ncbi:MAG: hypothetical protein VX024_01955 [SAR324 cluster bacterium]|nr:hypothetical protein [SAR324 cluster bacterium]